MSNSRNGELLGENKQAKSVQGRSNTLVERFLQGAGGSKRVCDSDSLLQPKRLNVERSFKLEGDIQTPQRMRLSSIKVSIIMFMKWNLNLFNGTKTIDKEAFFNSLFESERLVKEYVRARNVLVDNELGGDLYKATDADDLQFTQNAEEDELFAEDDDSDDERFCDDI